MIHLDAEFLDELGLGDLPLETTRLMLATVYEQLELRVGYLLASDMSSDQLDEFEGFIDSGDEPAALAWLESNCPNYSAVVRETFENLKMEILDNRVEIRSILTDAAPVSLVEFLGEIDDCVDSRLSRDLFIHVGGVEAVCEASAELLEAVPGIASSLVEKILEHRQRCRAEVTLERPPGLRASVFESLLDVFGSWERLVSAPDSEILAVRGVGGATLAKIRGFQAAMRQESE